eukprot:2193618-Prymnesium_polylepis.1
MSNAHPWSRGIKCGSAALPCELSRVSRCHVHARPHAPLGSALSPCTHTSATALNATWCPSGDRARAPTAPTARLSPARPPAASPGCARPPPSPSSQPLGARHSSRQRASPPQTPSHARLRPGSSTARLHPRASTRPWRCLACRRSSARRARVGRPSVTLGRSAAARGAGQRREGRARARGERHARPGHGNGCEGGAVAAR